MIGTIRCSGEGFFVVPAVLGCNVFTPDPKVNIGISRLKYDIQSLIGCLVLVVVGDTSLSPIGQLDAELQRN